MIMYYQVIENYFIINLKLYKHIEILSLILKLVHIIYAHIITHNANGDFIYLPLLCDHYS